MKKQIAASKCKKKRSRKLPVQWEEGETFHLSPKRGQSLETLPASKDAPLIKSNGTTHFLHAG